MKTVTIHGGRVLNISRVHTARLGVALLTLAGLILWSPAAWACQYVPGADILPSADRPANLPSDAAFSFFVAENDEITIEISLVDGAGVDVELGDPQRVSSSWVHEYWTIAPVDSLQPGHYVLTTTPGTIAPSDVWEFAVTDEADHLDLPPLRVLFSAEETNRPQCGNGGRWRAYVDIVGEEPLPQVAYLVSEFEMPDGTTITRGSYPHWGEDADDPGWNPDRRSVHIVEPFASGPDCVTTSAVLVTGERVALPRTCGLVGGGGCTVAVVARSTPAGLVLVVLLVMCGRRRK